MSHFEYKLHQLTNFLGEKKLKQLGLLTCQTCNHIMSHAEGLIPPSGLSDRSYLTPAELADINKQLYGSTLANNTSSYLSFPDEASEISEVSIDNLSSDRCSISPTNSTTFLSPSSEINSPSKHFTAKSPYQARPMTAEQLLAEILLDITTAHPPMDQNLGMGYIYNIYPPSPPHALACTECNRLYAIAHPLLQLMPLPVMLTNAEYEMLKGVYVDIVL